MTFNVPEMPKRDKQDVVGLASAYAAETLIEEHAHTAHQFVHAISGIIRVTSRNKVWFTPPGCALWIPANEIHSVHCVGRVEMRSAYFSEFYKPALESVTLISVSSLMREVLIRLAEQEEPRLKLTLADILLDEIQHAPLVPFNIPMPQEPRIARLIHHLKKDPSDHTTLKEWAKKLGLSERNLIRYIRNETGLNFRELRRQVRILISLELLAQKKSVTETAFDVGFETPSAFIHAFRDITGNTPLQFLSNKEK